jgi:hypothetical protein
LSRVDYPFLPTGTLGIATKKFPTKYTVKKQIEAQEKQKHCVVSHTNPTSSNWLGLSNILVTSCNVNTDSYGFILRLSEDKTSYK